MLPNRRVQRDQVAQRLPRKNLEFLVTPPITPGSRPRFGSGDNVLPSGWGFPQDLSNGHAGIQAICKFTSLMPVCPGPFTVSVPQRIPMVMEELIDLDILNSRHVLYKVIRNR